MKAIKLLAELHSCGVIVEAAGEQLRIDAPKGAITPELRVALVQRKVEILSLLKLTDSEIAWRVQAMLVQIPNKGAIPLLVAKPGKTTKKGLCLSCGDCLIGNEVSRCSLCNRAANLALDLSMSDPGEKFEEK